MKNLLATILLTAVIGCAATGFASELSLDGVTGLALDGASGTGPNAIIAPLTYNGTTVGSPTFNRPIANGTSAPTSLSGVGTAVAYDVVVFSVSANANYSFLSTVTSSGYDNYTLLYTGVFNPSAPLTNVVIGNDDLTSTTTSGFTRALTTGTTYSFVTTGFANTDAGTFTNAITLAPVPEPSAWMMIGAGFLGLAAVQRFRRITL